MKSTIYRLSDDMKLSMDEKTGEVFEGLYQRISKIAENVFMKGEIHNFRYCKACVYSLNNIHVLRSYETIVAIIIDDVCYDILRTEYGYTSTSAWQIAKFVQDYEANKIIRFKWA